ncbi:hypothetical protein Micbo1qcDRAFT_180857 [Microdochium bolleyi]|uniref:Uncharacterized protein n=1 Tax=Microdochium bolleyi TaxID=196109 RepID=A0A136IKW8_9PEZI|nr:hypothetical protein Micbo1qcDRAFT_180857 [Microdochium bolleyi]
MHLSILAMLVLPLHLIASLALPAGSGLDLLGSERRESLSNVDKPALVATRAISQSIASNYLPVIRKDGEEVAHLEGRPVVKRSEVLAHLEGRPVVKRSEVLAHLEGRPVVKRGEAVAHLGGAPVDKRSIQHVHQIIPPGEIAGDY